MTDDYYFCPLTSEMPDYDFSIIERGRWEQMIAWQNTQGFKGFVNMTGSNRFVKIPIERRLF